MRHPKEREPANGVSRREFLRRAAAAGIAVPSLSAILAACGSGAQTTVGGGSASASGGSAAANKFGTGGIAGAPYPLARQDAVGGDEFFLEPVESCHRGVSCFAIVNSDLSSS